MKLVTLVTAAIVLASRLGQAQIAADTNSYDWLINAAHNAVDRGEFFIAEAIKFIFD